MNNEQWEREQRLATALRVAVDALNHQVRIATENGLTVHLDTHVVAVIGAPDMPVTRVRVARPL